VEGGKEIHRILVSKSLGSVYTAPHAKPFNGVIHATADRHQPIHKSAAGNIPPQGCNNNSLVVLLIQLNLKKFTLLSFRPLVQCLLSFLHEALEYSSQSHRPIEINSRSDGSGRAYLALPGTIHYDFLSQRFHQWRSRLQ
jgi:hypothetical protein